ncbi:MAG: hypothetical protein JXA25_09710 [Anaerolineales bacterium]|nr:hypothetical protein [Anaerolineales bacterium]
MESRKISISREVGEKIRTKILPGALFAVALILIEAGIGAFMIGKNAACREEAERLRERFVSSDMCISDEAGKFAEVLFRGPFFMMDSEVSPWASLTLTAVVYGVIGGVASLLRLRWGFLLFLLIHLVLLGAGTLTGILMLYSL